MIPLSVASYSSEYSKSKKKSMVCLVTLFDLTINGIRTKEIFFFSWQASLLHTSHPQTVYDVVLLYNSQLNIKRASMVFK